jgi:hypothetical protein
MINTKMIAAAQVNTITILSRCEASLGGVGLDGAVAEMKNEKAMLHEATLRNT